MLFCFSLFSVLIYILFFIHILYFSFLNLIDFVVLFFFFLCSNIPSKFSSNCLFLVSPSSATWVEYSPEFSICGWKVHIQVQPRWLYSSEVFLAHCAGPWGLSGTCFGPLQGGFLAGERVAEQGLCLIGGEAKHVRMTILACRAFVRCLVCQAIEMTMDFLPVSCTVLMTFLWMNHVVGESIDLGDDMISPLIVLAYNQAPPPAYQTQAGTQSWGWLNHPMALGVGFFLLIFLNFFSFSSSSFFLSFFFLGVFYILLKKKLDYLCIFAKLGGHRHFWKFRRNIIPIESLR